MSSTNKTANYELSQFVGTDIPSILNDYNGDMRKIDTAIKAVANAEGSSASDIAGLQATVGQHTTEISGLSSTVNSLSGRVIGIEGKIPASASESNKLITAQDIPEIPSVEQLEQDVATLQTNVSDLQEEVSDVSDDVKAIQLCVPANASSSNQLATMANVHDEIYSPTSLLYGEPITNTTFSKNDYTTMGDLFKAVYDKVLEIYNTASINTSVALTVIAENKQFVLYPVKSAVTGTQTSFTFKGAFISTGSATPIIEAYMEVTNSNSGAYFIERALTFANSYYGDNIPSPITNGAVTGYEIKHTSDETTTSPTAVIVYKMINKAIV